MGKRLKILFVIICHCVFRSIIFGRGIPLLEFYFVMYSRCHSFHHLLHAFIRPSCLFHLSLSRLQKPSMNTSLTPEFIRRSHSL
jgi:hypothetical protein